MSASCSNSVLHVPHIVEIRIYQGKAHTRTDTSLLALTSSLSRGIRLLEGESIQRDRPFSLRQLHRYTPQEQNNRTVSDNRCILMSLTLSRLLLSKVLFFRKSVFWIAQMSASESNVPCNVPPKTYGVSHNKYNTKRSTPRDDSRFAAFSGSALGAHCLLAEQSGPLDITITGAKPSHY